MSENRSDPLLEYRKKRDPERTPEPFTGRRAGGGRLFVVQKHAARRLHYDLRLEMEGVLKSWAVPRGPSLRREEKRLAVQVEDHPLEYADFEGVIPEGNYGAGAVIVWDQGWYRLVKGEDPQEQLARGKLELEFFGFKMRGLWVLARMGGKEKEWLLLKKADASASGDELTERYPESVLSGLTVEEVRDSSGKLSILRSRLDTAKARSVDLSPGRQAFMLAYSAERPFSSKDWLFELKYDGVRALASRRGEAVDLYGRGNRRITERYPEVVRALRALPAQSFILDGEIVALDENGRPSFQRLQARMHLTNPFDIERGRATVPVIGIFFDCLTVEDRDLRSLPLIERKELLKLLLPRRGVVQYSDHILEHGEAFFAAASEQRLEGIIAKRIQSRYTGRRSREWLKIKCQLRQEFVIGGYTNPRGSRAHFGALHLGLYEDGSLVYVSKVGTGFDQASLKTISKRLEPLRTDRSPFHAGTPAGSGNYWVEPKLVCEVRFTEWTRDGGIRNPAFLGLRDDNRPEECRREKPPEVKPPASSGERPKLTISNPKKIFWPKEGYTKQDLVSYYEAVASFLLPYLKDRPLVLTRYPDGIEGKSFFQKDAPEFVPEWIRTESIYSQEAGREIHYFIVDDPDMLRYVANLGTIPLHIWSSRLSFLDRPDWLILDLDPKGAPFADVVRLARTLHQILERLEIPSYAKTSGASGLHILIPLGTRYSYEEARNFAKLVALLAVRIEPDLGTLVRQVRAREGKVYIDYIQNGHGRTIVAPFSARPLPGAPVSCPLRWPEVTARLNPGRFTIKTILSRLEKNGDPMAPILKDSFDMARALSRMEDEFGEELS